MAPNKGPSRRVEAFVGDVDVNTKSIKKIIFGGGNRRIKRIKRAEKKDRAAERIDETYLANRLEVADATLDRKDKETYDESVKLSVAKHLEFGNIEEKEDLRGFVIKDVMTQGTYKLLLEEWNNNEGANKREGESHDEYIIRMGMEFIIENLLILIEGRVRSSLDEISFTNDLEDEEKNQLVDDIRDFVEINKNDLAGKESKDALLGAFIDLFNKNNINPDQEDKIEILFDEIVKDIEYAAIISKIYSLIGEDMLAGIDLSEEEWNEMLLEAAKRKTKGTELEEVIKEDHSYVAGPAYDSSDIEAGTLSDVEEAEQSNNVIISGGPIVFYIQFEKGEKVRMEKEEDNAIYYIRDDWADEQKRTERSVTGDITNAIKIGGSSLSKTIARMELERKMFETDFVFKEGGSRDEINRLLSDSRIVMIAERMLGYELGSKKMQREEINAFLKFITVLIRDDMGEYDGVELASFESRVKYVTKKFTVDPNFAELSLLRIKELKTTEKQNDDSETGMPSLSTFFNMIDIEKGGGFRIG